MATTRETALKHAMMRTAKFDNIFKNYSGASKSTVFKILNLKNSYYKIFIQHDEGISMLEIMNLHIICFQAASKGEQYYLDDLSDEGYLLISGIEKNNVSLSIEYYDSFEYIIEMDSINGIEFDGVIESDNTDMTYVENVNGKNINVDNLNVSNINAKSINTRNIIFGKWKFAVSEDGTTVTVGK